MGEAIIASIITGSISLIGMLIAHFQSVRKLREDNLIFQAQVKVELGHIKDDLKEHNGYAKMFAESMPVVKEQIKVINHRIEDLEKKVG